MQTAKQSLPKTFYNESKNWYCDTRWNRSYENYMKRYYHKIRRQYDDKVIERQLEHFDTRYDEYDWGFDSLMDKPDWNENLIYEWKEHNTKQKLSTSLH